ncbi:MAG: HupE/UreJ family protein, partial [Gemmatimonadaceae bacterium]
ITDLGALDHILFLLVLAAIYRLGDWRESLWVVTAFTVGHSITLALAVTGALRMPTDLIEFLIPVTIVATGIENVIVRERKNAPWRGRYRPVFACVFGLVHGAGFANYLNSLFVDRIALPLLGFNIGIEVGQIVVLALITGALFGVDRLIGLIRLPLTAPAPHRLRAVAVSLTVAMVATRWAVERSPW